MYKAKIEDYFNSDSNVITFADSKEIIESMKEVEAAIRSETKNLATLTRLLVEAEAEEYKAKFTKEHQ